ncbi:MAG: right-handed parallel beta-helix repeat-containing protein [Actinomycetota bacterium]|nr:right-handed parallel beta-helix repeat-containing protein [Actinomycetota bacterium]
MSSRRRIAIAGFAFLLVTAGTLTVDPAGAAHLACGQVVTTSVTLDSDLFCPTGNGLILQGNGLVLNLNGHTIRGQLDSRTVSQPNALGDNGVLGGPYTTRFATGQFVGIDIRGSRNVVVGPGTVKHFAAGVVINGFNGGGYNTVRGLTVEENIGPPVSEFFGDGIMVLESSNNRVGLNTVRNNGAYDGIVLLGNADSNLIHDNRVAENVVPETCPNEDVFVFSVSGGGQQHLCGPTHPTRKPFTFVNQQNHGIKLEVGGSGGAPNNNIVQNNLITGNGNTGIFVPTTCPDLGETAQQECFGEQISDNLFRGNQANANGFGYPAGLPDRRVFEGPVNGGGGMTIMIGGPKPAIRSNVTGNTFNDNARDGVAVLPHRAGSGVTSSYFRSNTALRNNKLNGGIPAFNGQDGNVFINPQTPCDNNVWANNNFGSSPADIGGPIPPNNLSSHPCVGPVLPPSPTQASAARESTPAGPVRLSRG